ncbi:MAG TPA: MBL fold metallo-hydrolase [Bacteroidia bacterium]|nr:MBL fold metallo-hydrolase [Bacteroidia bacterium]
MYIHQFYTNCLAQAAYYVESDREALIIDPLRDPEPYIEFARSRGASIKFILETHFHADFVSGHLDLAAATKAAIVFGPDATPSYPAYIAKDHERLRIGKTEIEILHTPGHTVESSCFLLYDEAKNPHAVFTGDTLFAGDVGRPDLLSGNLDAETLAAKLYDSIQKIKTLPDDVIVYPGHGAGSACGKNIGKETMTTIGEQKKKNYALQEIPREVFVSLVTNDQPAAPAYFFSDAKLNKSGYEPFEKVLSHGLHFVEAPEFDRMKREGLTILDTRDPEEFAKGFVPGSVNIGLEGDFAVWVGTLFSFGTKFLLVTEKGKEKESVTRLARIGFDHVEGILKGGMENWISGGRPADRIAQLSPMEFMQEAATGKYVVLDVRRKGEAEKKRLLHASNLPLAELKDKVHRLDPKENFILCCAGGYRSMIAASLLKAEGFDNVQNIAGGVSKILTEIPELIEMEE